MKMIDTALLRFLVREKGYGCNLHGKLAPTLINLSIQNSKTHIYEPDLQILRIYIWRIYEASGKDQDWYLFDPAENSRDLTELYG